ncbi:MAG TPA: long-chain fatty acid--CoA ligase [Solirubrobacteraceae bacterium]|nr:long-chain fatty acid--CoA ligase [Solirubrobacteraceae bacterium]
MTQNLAQNLLITAAQHPERAALCFQDSAITYAELDSLTARLAGKLTDRGLRPGDRVGLMLPNVPEFAVAYYGVLRAGGAVVPMNVLLKEREATFYLGDSGARLIIGWASYSRAALIAADEVGAECLVLSPGSLREVLEEVEPLGSVVARDRSDTAVILYTSGTTGKPKGAELTHSNLAINADVAKQLFSASPDDVILGALPLFHSFGQTCGLNVAVSSGASLALIERFDAGRVLSLIEEHGVTVFEGVPTMYAALLNHPEREQFDVRSLRVCVSGGAALAVELLRGFEEAFGCMILEGYGLSETSPVACFNHPNRIRKPGSIGTPVEGVEMRLVGDDRREVAPGEVGEIAIRGHNVMKGYWRRPEATAEAIDEAGWFYSGDLARVDSDGCFYIVDRKKELIIRGGYNVYPREIEEVLYEHPSVREAAVIGIADQDLGEEVGACVALKPGAELTESELREFVKANVAAYKYPRVVWFVDELPKGPTGKILKRAIVAPVALAEGGAA